MPCRVIMGLVVSVVLSTIATTARAQCLVSTDPDYGRGVRTAVPIGGALPVEQLLGGVVTVEQRRRIERYLQNLRGPEGEIPVVLYGGTAMTPDPIEPGKRSVVMWSYTVTLPSKTINLYLNLTDSGIVQAPAGFTCALETSLLDSVGGPSLRAGDAISIRYAASDCGNDNEAILPAAYEAARLTSSPAPVLPTGAMDVDPTVSLRVLVDVEGRFEQPVVLNGPESLRAAAVEAIKGWTVTPARVNGSPVFSCSTLRVTFTHP